jgi:hypothetical protein
MQDLGKTLERKVDMNKQKFRVVQSNWNAIAPKIGTTEGHMSKLIMKVKDTGKGPFSEMEVSRDNVGQVVFMDLFEKKHFPSFFYQIGTEGFLSHAEMDSLDSILPRFMNY